MCAEIETVACQRQVRLAECGDRSEAAGWSLQCPRRLTTDDEDEDENGNRCAPPV